MTAWRMPVVRYRIVAITPGGFTETSTMSPQAAANRDPEKFRQLYAAMTRAARPLANTQENPE
jgi:hypothetical protein